MTPLLEAARPRQWVKNLFVAAPLLFSKQLTDGTVAARTLAAVAIFCALSSAVYLLNDVVDVDKDRAHPRKCKRPIPDGRLSITAAKVAAAVLAAVSLSLGLLLGFEFACAAAGYLALNIAYSFYLKHVVYLDVLAIAGGFLLRVIAGAAAITVYMSPYLLLCTGLLACFLGFGKRAHELESAGTRAHEQRAVLREYRGGQLRGALYLTGAATFIAYIFYTRAAHTLAFFHTNKMVWTTPFAAFGLYRFLRLVGDHPHGDSPTEEMLRDWPFILNLVLYGLAVLWIIY